MVAPLVAAGLIAGGASLFSGAMNYFGGREATNVSAEAALKNTQKQIEWEKERARNAHQWEIEDLKKAGLNPILSAGGSGAATGGISPQMPDTTGIHSAYSGIGQAINNGLNFFTTAQQIKNDTDRVINETKETNSDLSMKRTQIELMLEEKLNKAVERGWLKEKQATEIKNRAKLQSDIELNRSQEFLNEQLRGRAEYEMKNLEKEKELLEAELELHPTRKRRMEIENDLNEKENKIFYIRETVSELTRLGGMGLSLYGTYQAGKALSAYKANNMNDKTKYTESYGKHGEFLGTKRSYYR